MIDVTDRPFPCILESRPVYIIIVREISAEAAKSGPAFAPRGQGGLVGGVGAIKERL